jgi:hypothetical protein
MTATFDPVTDTMNTREKIEKTFECAAGHITTGTALLRHNKGYTCPRPFCGQPVTDISKTEEGQLYHAFARPDLGVKR